MITKFLEGKEIYFSLLEQDVKELCVKWLNDPEVSRNLKGHFPVTNSFEEEYIKKAYKDNKNIHFIIRKNLDDKAIGSCGLHFINYIDGKAEFGIFIGEKEEWGKGYGTEATSMVLGYGFNTLNLHRIELKVYQFNERAINCYKKVGFIEEGRLREFRLMDGKYYDAIVMGILANEYKKN